MRSRIKAVLGTFVAVITMLSATSCGGSDAKPADSDEQVTTVEDPSESPSASEDAEAHLPSDEDVEAFFEAMASSDPFAMEQAKKYVGRGSVAEAYLGYFTALTTAAIDGGQPYAADTLTKTDEGYEACSAGPAGQDNCSVWGNVEGRNGKIVNFTVDGQEIGPRISSGNGRSVRAGELAELTLLYAYKAISSGDLFVCSEIRSKSSGISFQVLGASYRDRTGRQSKSNNGIGPSDLVPESRATICQIFTGANPGGEVTMEVWEGDEGMGYGTLTFPTR